ncbi:MAG: hypothetical protein HY865_00090 [Chloroflexi bacterium]|nr:hypothetical protein [Chloroflexota bacterium]
MTIKNSHEDGSSAAGGAHQAACWARGKRYSHKIACLKALVANGELSPWMTAHPSWGQMPYCVSKNSSKPGISS